MKHQFKDLHMFLPAQLWLSARYIFSSPSPHPSLNLLILVLRSTRTIASYNTSPHLPRRPKYPFYTLFKIREKPLINKMSYSRARGAVNPEEKERPKALFKQYLQFIMTKAKCTFLIASQWWRRNNPSPWILHILPDSGHIHSRQDIPFIHI